jgi:hypothetical protein
MKKEFAVILAIFCVIAFCIAPAAATTGDSATKTVDVIVSPSYDPIPQTRASISGTITQGQTKDYDYPLPPGKTKLTVQLSWGTTSNSLGLIVITAGGSTHGEFDDYYESPIANGLVPVQFEATVLSSGTWTLTVHGISVSGSQPFTLSAIAT